MTSDTKPTVIFTFADSLTTEQAERLTKLLRETLGSRYEVLIVDQCNGVTVIP